MQRIRVTLFESVEKTTKMNMSSTYNVEAIINATLST